MCKCKKSKVNKKSKESKGCPVCRILKKIALIAGCLFGVTFLVYFFNLDMKLTAKLEPLFAKHYDKMERDKHL